MISQNVFCGHSKYPLQSYPHERTILDPLALCWDIAMKYKIDKSNENP